MQQIKVNIKSQIKSISMFVLCFSPLAGFIVRCIIQRYATKT